ncbi:MAG: hypothetical protein Ct9H90mP16_04820 [Candidatus Poseidoniales archaeon]|nr:MAG: hypothetical protein Ct9H90mP16_04820 [Candidatus Poseidoniales archaeon]
MSADILVVFKKNFESVHDRAMVSNPIGFGEIGPRTGHSSGVHRWEKKVRHSDFIGRDLVIVVGGDGPFNQHRSQCGFSDTPVMGVNSHPRKN